MKTLIIGGGMAGLTYAIMAAKNGIDTVLCEKNSRVGKKIAMAGNGKCNIGNLKVSADVFNDSQLVRAVLHSVPVETYLQFLESCGIYTFADSAGRLYPLSESAANVVDCLRYLLEKLGGKIITDCEVTSVRPDNCGYTVKMGGSECKFDRVVLACGSKSSASQTNAQSLIGEGYFTPTCPSLVPVKIAAMDKLLNGLRAKATVTLLQDGIPVGCERGEVQFKEYGLSGICVYNLSAIIARNVVAGKQHKYEFSVDLVPGMSEESLTDILRDRMSDPKTLFYGILHNKLGECVAKHAAATTAEELARSAKALIFPFDKLLDYSMSQVTAGGIAEKYLDKNLSTPNGIVAVGEVLNVDGLCGGNNLYFAAASALYLFDEQQRARAFGKK